MRIDTGIGSEAEEMAEEALCQVQIVTFDSHDVIEPCLMSVAHQANVALRVVLIDNASADGSADAARAAWDRTNRDMPLTVIENAENAGYAAAHNQGFALALRDGLPFVLTLNPDVQLDPHYVERCIGAIEGIRMQTGLLVAGATGKLLRPPARAGGGAAKAGARLENGRMPRPASGPVRIASGDTPDDGMAAAAPGVLDSAGLAMGALFHARDRGSGKRDEGQYEKRELVWGVCGAAALFAGAFLDEMSARGGVFDETFFAYKEDVDLCWRAGLAAWAFVYEPDATALHARGWRKGRGGKDGRGKTGEGRDARSRDISDDLLAHSFSNQLTMLYTYVPRSHPALWLSLLAESARFLSLAALHPDAARKVLALLAERWESMRAKRWEWRVRR